MPRRPNFNTEETRVLLNEAEKMKAVICGPITPTNNLRKRDEVWMQIATKVNAVAPVERSVIELKRKFKDLKSIAKRKLAADHRNMCLTGGGGASTSTCTTEDERAASFLTNTSVRGIAGGNEVGEYQIRPECELENAEHQSSPDLEIIYYHPPQEIEIEKMNKETQTEREKLSSTEQLIECSRHQIRILDRLATASERIAASLEKFIEKLE